MSRDLAGRAARGFAFAATFGFAAAAAAQETVPSSDEIIRALTPRAEPTRAISIGVGADAEEPGMPPGPMEPAERPSMSFTQIQFEFNSDQLTPAARQVLAEIGIALRSHELGPYRFAITGHTDAVGSDAYNMNLSQRRARTVRDYLVSTFNIEPGRLESQGLGETVLADPGNPTSGVNRRVEVTNLGG